MIEHVWVEMTNALHNGENVHIIVYNKEEKDMEGAVEFLDGLYR
jgi:hypothetical protein